MNFRHQISSTALAALMMGSFTTDVIASEREVDLVFQKDDRTVYSPAYFNRYAPQTANEMVSQVPGFTLVGADRFGGGNAERGLGQGDGNLLINGRRPSTKDNGPLVLLGRIPSENVQRIEILTGGSTELAGQSGLIVNVVVDEAEEITGSWKAQYYRSEGGTEMPRAEMSVNGKIATVGYTAGLSWTKNNYPQWGPEYAYDGNHDLTEIRDEINRFEGTNLAFNLGLDWQGDGGQEGNITFRTTRNRSNPSESSVWYMPGVGEAFGDLFGGSEYSGNGKNFNYEIGGDYAFPIGKGTAKVIGLRRYSNRTSENYFDMVEEGEDDYTFNSIRRPTSSENILRTLYTLTPRKGHTLEFSLEGVKNKLATEAEYEEDSGSGLEPIIIDGSNVTISEDRAEANVQYSRPLGDKWTLQSSIGLEYSRISVTGDSERSDSFARPKGFVGVNYAPAEGTRFRARLDRSVGQLNFYDFASSTNAQEGTSNNGNENLVPDQTWRAEVTYERDFKGGHTFKVTGFYDRIDDYITFIPLGDDGEGRGNVDRATRLGVEAQTTINMEAFGIKGAKLDIELERQRTRMIDPFTGEKREIGAPNGFNNGGNSKLTYKISFRHDIPNTDIAWGGWIEDRGTNITYRRDQLLSQAHKWPQAHVVFFEYKNIFGMNARLEVEDFAGFTWLRNRTFFDGGRLGSVTGSEEGFRHSPWQARFSLTGNF